MLTPSTPGAPSLAATIRQAVSSASAPIDPVIQRVKPELRLLLGLLAQLRPQRGEFLRQATRRLVFCQPFQLFRFFRSGTFRSSGSPRFSFEALLPAGPLRSTGITPLLRYYGPLRLPPRLAFRLCLPVGVLLPGRVSQVPRLFFRRTPSPFTPESPTIAFPRFFTVGTGFILFGRLATLIGVTRPNRVRLRYGLRLCRLEASPSGSLRFALV